MISPARFSVQQVVLVNLLFVVFIVAGVVVYHALPVDVYPDISLDTAVIRTDWYGASAEDVERLITKKIEDEVEDVAGLSRIVSYSQQDFSAVGVKFDEELKPEAFEASFQAVRERLDRVQDLPDTAEPPELTRLTVGEIWAVVQVGVIDEAEVGEKVIRQIARNLKDRLREVEGVAKVRITGDRERQLHVLVDKDQLEKYGLSLTDVAQILSTTNQNIPAGTLEITADGAAPGADGTDASDGELVMRAVGDLAAPEALRDVIIRKSPTGAHVRLGDLAEIREGFERRIFDARFDGKPCMLLDVAKEHQADAVELRDRIDAFLTEYQEKHVRNGVRIAFTNDSTVMIRSRLNVLKRNLGVGMILVFSAMWMFIGLRNSMLALVGIPFAFLCAFLFMWMIDVSINAVSVFSLVLVSGIIVDDAIVVLENIYRHVQEGKPLQAAVIDGTGEVLWPVCTATATTLGAFLPMLIMPGVIGKFFAIIPKTVTVALIASLFECLIILPAHYLDWGPRGKKKVGRDRLDHERPAGSIARLGLKLRGAYERLLTEVLGVRYLFAVVLVVAVVFAMQASRFLRVEMFPSDFPLFIVDVNARPEASLRETTRITDRMFTVFDEFPDDIRRYSCGLGVQFNEDSQLLQRPNIAQVWVELSQQAQEKRDPEAVMNAVRDALLAWMARTPDHGIESIRVWPIQDGPPVGKPVAIRVEHNDYGVAAGIAERIKGRLRQIDGVYDVTDNLDLGQHEVRLTLDEAQAAEHGLTFLDAATVLRGANEGLLAGIYKDTEYDEDVDIMVKYARGYRRSINDMLDADVRAPDGALVKLGQIASVQFDQTYAALYHYNTRRAVLVTANIDTERGADATSVNRLIQAEFSPLTEQIDDLNIVSGGQYEETHKSFASLRYAAVISVCVIYLVMAAQFRSYLQPIVVIMAIVFGAVGMTLGLVAHGYPFSVVTAVAMVGLCGVAVNDAIVLISFVNDERNRGTPVFEAVCIACRRRARPIVLTTVTTVLGLLPMALGLGGYSKIWSPFATIMCYGLSAATVLTLVLVPAFYMMVDDVKRWTTQRFARADSADAVSAVD